MSELIKKCEKLIAVGDLAKSIELADSISNSSSKELNTQLDSLKQVAMRTYIDFSLSEKDVDALLSEKIGQFTAMQKKEWEDKKWLEFRNIDGEKKYFKRAVSNLKLRLEKQAVDFEINKQTDNFEQFKSQYAEKIIQNSNGAGNFTNPQEFEINYTVTLQANAVPQGEVVRCWLPWPKENHSRQSEVIFISSIPEKHNIAPTETNQRSVYFEQKALKNKPTVFNIRFRVKTTAQYFNPEKLALTPYNKDSEIYKNYTIEQKPHIVFNNRVRQLADSITGNETNPYKIVKNIYEYICNQIIWSGALEYSIFECIPDYVLNNKKGDCGMQTLLFMSLVRYKGIPVRWQSGWMLHPDRVNLHDWCEVYYEGTGWVPVDMSFQKTIHKEEKVKNFYLTGIDAYRLIINDAIATQLFPQKKFMRSEPFDFQRGELEWKEGNLYFDKWTYHMDVKYLTPTQTNNHYKK